MLHTPSNPFLLFPLPQHAPPLYFNTPSSPLFFDHPYFLPFFSGNACLRQWWLLFKIISNNEDNNGNNTNPLFIITYLLGSGWSLWIVLLLLFGFAPLKTTSPMSDLYISARYNVSLEVVLHQLAIC